MGLRFLQISDMHLGRKLGGVPAGIAQGLAQAAREAVRAALQTARAEAVDLVLMPGDLFEQDGDDPPGQLRFIYEQAAQLASIPVVIAPGNHDAYSPSSPYATETPPGNVVLFTARGFTTCDTSAGPVTGRAYQAGETSFALDWSALPAAPGSAALLCVHAAVLHAGDGRALPYIIAPVTTETLAQTGYAYTALGHYHTFSQFQRRPGGAAYAAYAGCPQGLGWDEVGPKGYLRGELSASGAELKFQPAAAHIWQRASLHLPPYYAADAAPRLAALLQDLRGQLASADMLRLEVAGEWPEAERSRLLDALDTLTRAAWFAPPPDLSRTAFVPGLAPEGVSAALDKFLALAAARGEQGGADGEAWQLARFLGHRLLSGQGLPEEVA